MVISEQQLEIWSNTGADVGSTKAYDRIKNIIDSSNFSKKSEVDIFLQGSYANTTHIRADSDVDVVILLNSAFNSDISRLSQPERDEHSKLPKATYDHEQLRQELFDLFVRALGQNKVESRNKCIRINLGNGYLRVDLIPCLGYRLYYSYPNHFIEGISIKKPDGSIICNFPKLHKSNGARKHQDTNANYKKVVRIFKNMRNTQVEEGKITKSDAPSYFIECLLYNVPESYFSSNLQDSVFKSLKWLIDYRENFEQLKCQNGTTPMFGPDETQWKIEDCNFFLSTIVKLWNEA